MYSNCLGRGENPVKSGVIWRGNTHCVGLAARWVVHYGRGMIIEAAVGAFALRYPPRKKKLVAVSGGRDSVVLLQALFAAGHRKLVVCHLNHCLRGRVSAADAAFVRRLSAKMNVPCEVASADVRQMASANGESVETAGRKARHVFFGACARKHRCGTLVTAHHAGDQVETVLFNLFRGSSGLRGMKPETKIFPPGSRSALWIVRPFLDVTRADIDGWIARHGVKFREDASNRDPDPVRNKIRHELLPAICDAMGRDIRPALLRAARVAAEESAFLDELATPHAAAGELDVTTLSALPCALQRRVIYLWLQRQQLPGIGYREVESVRAMLQTPSPAGSVVNLPADRFVRRRKGKLCIPP